MNDVVMFISYMTLHTFALFFLCVLFDAIEEIAMGKLAGRISPPFLQSIYGRIILLHRSETEAAGAAVLSFRWMPLVALTLSLSILSGLSVIFVPVVNGFDGDLIYITLMLCLLTGAVAIGCLASPTKRARAAGEFELIQLLGQGTYFILLFSSIGWYAVQRGVSGELYSPLFYATNSLWSLTNGAGKMGFLFFLAAFFVMVPSKGRKGVSYPIVGDYRGKGLLLMSTAVSLRQLILYALLVLVFFPGLLLNTSDDVTIIMSLLLFWGIIGLVRFSGDMLARYLSSVSVNLQRAVPVFFIMLSLSTIGMLLLALDVLAW